MARDFDARTAKSEEVESRLAELTNPKRRIGVTTPAAPVPSSLPVSDAALGTQTGTTSSTAKRPAPSSAGDRFDARTAPLAAVEARLERLIGASRHRAAAHTGGR